MRAMCEGAAGTQGGGNHYRLGYFRLRATLVLGSFAMNLNAIRALRRHGDAESNQLLGLRRQHAISHRGSIKGHKSLPSRRGQFAKLFQFFDVGHVVHGSLLCRRLFAPFREN